MNCEKELHPVYDGRKSFYGKAVVESNGKGVETLFSYDTKVASIRDGKLTLFDDWNYSATTVRHVKEFMRQHGFQKMTKDEIEKEFWK